MSSRLSIVTFFQPLPPEPPEAPGGGPSGWRPPLWDRPSEALLGAPIDASLLLAKIDRLALVFHDVHAYPNGFTFHLGIVGNPMIARDRMGHGPPGFGPRFHQRGPRIGFEFADGSRTAVGGSNVPPAGAGTQRVVATAASVDERHNPYGARVDADGLPLEPVLIMRGGGGDMERFDQRFWCGRFGGAPNERAA